MDGDINVYFFKGIVEGESGWHFGVSCAEDIPVEKYVKFCKCLQTALDVLNGKEE